MNRRIKKALSVLLCAALLTGLTLPIAAGGGISSFEMSGSHTSNVAKNTYVRWSKVVRSYLGETDGQIVRVEYTSDGDLITERYSAAGELLSSGVIPMELPLFGGFFFGQTYNFAVFGQENLSEDTELEVIRVVKYSKAMQRLASVSYYGENTYIPFDAGSLRMAETADKLYIHTCHEMFAKSDGLHHQANMYFCVNQNTMKSLDSFTGVMNISYYGYVSHSFNQFIATDGTYVYRADHGDAYRRGISVTRFAVSAATAASTAYTVPLTFAGPVGANSTGATLGGMALSANNVLLAGSIDSQTGEYDSYSDIYSTEQRNIYVIVAPKTMQADANRIVYITSHAADAGIKVGTPHLTAIGGERFLLLWEETQDSLTRTRAALIDGSGVLQTEIHTLNARLSDCAPLLAGDGTVMWYTGDGQSQTLYRLDPVMLNESAHTAHIWNSGETLTEATCTEPGETLYTCTVCGETKTEPVEPLGHDYYKWEYIDEDYHKGICSRDESHVMIEEHMWRSAGYVDDLPTCTEPGTYRAHCPGCRQTLEKPSPALGHDFGDWEKLDDTCHQRVCSRDASHVETEGHIWGDPVTVGGQTVAACTVCGAIQSGTDDPPMPAIKLGDNVFAELDKNGTLRVSGTGPMYDYYEYTDLADHISPWSNSSITSVIIEDGVTTVGSCLFMNCKNLKHVQLASGVRSVGASAFRGCSALEEIVIPSGVVTVGNSAFKGCSGARRLKIGSNVNAIGSMAFARCGGLQEITVDDGNAYYESRSNCLTDKRTKCLIAGCANSVIPKDGSVASIGERAFENCFGLKKIVIPEAVTEIGYAAFRNCTALADITLEGNGKAIGNWAFFHCPGYHTETEVLYGGDCGKQENTVAWTLNSDGVFEIEGTGEMMSYCPLAPIMVFAPWTSEVESIERVVIGSGVTSIGGYTFQGCEILKSVTVPRSVKTIHFGSFGNCPALTDIYYAGSEEEWNDVEIYESEDVLENITVHFNCTAVPSPGDVDGDGTVTASDARLALRRAVELENYAEGSPEYLACDVDHDDKVTASDARIILRVAVGLETL